MNSKKKEKRIEVGRECVCGAKGELRGFRGYVIYFKSCILFYLIRKIDTVPNVVEETILNDGISKNFPIFVTPSFGLLTKFG